MVISFLFGVFVGVVIGIVAAAILLGAKKDTSE